MRRPSWIRLAAAASAALLGLASCTGEKDASPSADFTRTAPVTGTDDPKDEDGDQPSDEPAVEATAQPTDQPTTEVTGGPTREPLVLAVRPTRPAPRIGLALARSIIAGRVHTWKSLDGTPTALRVVPGPARAAARALARDARVVALLPASEVGPAMRAIVVAGVDPLRSPTRYPLRVPGPSPAAVTTLKVVGDIMLGRRVGSLARAAAHPAAPLRPMSRRLAAADLTVGNLESTLSKAGAPRQGADSFAAPPSVLTGLAAAGFDAISLANNHTGDYGARALLDTAEAFPGSGIRSFGAGRDLAAASRPVVLMRGGVRFGFLGFNAIGETPRATPERPGALSVRMPPRTGPLNRADLRHVLGLVRRLAARVDVVVVLPHWGRQYTHVAEPIQSRVGGRLIAAGATLVVGSHPHWVQGVEPNADGMIVHSLGNFVFDMDFMQQTREGVTLTATFWGDELKGVTFTPYVIGPGFAPRPATGSVGRRILADVWRHSTPPFRVP